MWFLNWNGEPFFEDSRIFEGEFWRPITSTILHSNLLHLALNLYWLWLFGTILEPRLGSRALAAISLALAIGSSMSQYALEGAGIGLSGVIYGYFALLWVLSRRDVRFARALNRSTINLFLAGFVICWILTQTGSLKVGNVAHASGAILGALVGITITSSGHKRVAANLAFAAVVLAVVLIGWNRKPDALELSYLAYRDLEKGNYSRAADRYEQALEQKPNEPDWWANLGFARLAQRKHKQALAAYEQASKRRPQDKNLQDGMLSTKFMVAYDDQIAGLLDPAIALYEQILSLDPNQADAWFNLSLAKDALEIRTLHSQQSRGLRSCNH